MERIKNKKAYWGTYTFEAVPISDKGKELVRIDVYKNSPRKHENSYTVNSIEELKEMSANQDCSLRVYTGDLNGTRECKTVKEDKRKKKNIAVTELIPAIDCFIECFKYKIEN